MASEAAFHIRTARKDDEAQWRKLWRGYNLFYEAPWVTEETTTATWERILNDQSTIGCLVAEESGVMLGFINYVIHPRTWSHKDCCYLEDLFVSEEARGKGIARTLCMGLKELCAQKDLSQIYWNTRKSNKTARKLYDQIGVKDDFIRYVMKLS